MGEAHVQVERTDVAMQTEQVEDEQKRVAAEKVLESLRKVEDVVTGALQTAEMLTESERKMKERMEAISHKVEEALSRTTDTENQLRGLEAWVSSCTTVRPLVRCSFSRIYDVDLVDLFIMESLISCCLH